MLVLILCNGPHSPSTTDCHRNPRFGNPRLLIYQNYAYDVEDEFETAWSKGTKRGGTDYVRGETLEVSIERVDLSFHDDGQGNLILLPDGDFFPPIIMVRGVPFRNGTR
jgi:hypothetical protein